jgi:uncharacterized membrane protein (DUF485 family)
MSGMRPLYTRAIGYERPQATGEVAVRDVGRGLHDLDWEAIERLPEFQELTAGRRRFAWIAGGIGIGLGALYVVLAGVAPDLMGTKVIGSMSLGFAGGVGLILLTWLITFLYVRRSNRVWGPLEESVRRRVAETEPRFSRDAEAVATERARS